MPVPVPAFVTFRLFCCICREACTDRMGCRYIRKVVSRHRTLRTAVDHHTAYRIVGIRADRKAPACPVVYHYAA